MYAAFNVIPGKKELHIFQETQHWTFPEQNELKNEWLYQMLKK
jgi:cephalosporin-C deacetylase-like acetyl esterase